MTIRNLSLDVTGVILAGGKSRRMGRRNKAFLELGGRPLIEIVIERVASVCAEVLVVSSDARPFAGLGVPVIEDRFRGVGVLGGLHAGLEAAAHELALVVGCDMPFLDSDLLRAFAGWAEGFDAVVLRHSSSSTGGESPLPPPPTGGESPLPSPPVGGESLLPPPPVGVPSSPVGGKSPFPSPPVGGKEGGKIEPLHAAYRRTCLSAMEAAIRAGERRIVSFFPHVRVRYVAQEVASIDPTLRSFRNVNTPREWEATQAEWVEAS